MKARAGLAVLILVCLLVVSAPTQVQAYDAQRDSEAMETRQDVDKVIYVDADATGMSTGTSWEDALTSLSDALMIASPGDEIWVASGTYTPGLDRTSSFQMKNGVAIYGGFAGNETSLEERDWGANVTILSGDIGVSGDSSDNCYHVFYHPAGTNLDSTAILDGFTISGGNANDDSTHPYGGGMYNHTSSPTITNCTFSENSALDGGGMYSYNSSLIITNCTFSENSVSRYCGGMYNHTSSPTITNCTFSENSALDGGGMYSYNSSPTITDCTFSGNSVSSYGGGMYNNSSSPAITDCIFSGNSALDGGGMYNYNSTSQVTNCTFSGNSVSRWGGGMYNNSSSPTITDCTFSKNSALNDGGGMCSYNSSPTITDCTFSENSTGNSGGGMLNCYYSPTITNCTFSGNSASNDGGGIYNNSSSLTITNCTFSGNSVSRWGGGMYNNSSSPQVTNCTFSGNSGKGMYNYNSSPTITNCTFAQNIGSGIYNIYYSSPTVTNCILWGDSQKEIYTDSNSSPVVTYSDVGGGYTGTGNINVGPAFADWAGSDFHLQASSPCIDSGSNAALPADTADLDGDGDTTEPIPYDFEGDPRVFGSTVDMGADESEVVNLPPVASANGPYTGVTSVCLTFDGNGSSDLDGTIVSYEWDLDGDGNFDNATGKVVQHMWTEVYSGNISLRVTDNKGATAIYTTTATIVAERTSFEEPMPEIVGVTVHINCRASNPDLTGPSGSYKATQLIQTTPSSPLFYAQSGDGSIAYISLTSQWWDYPYTWSTNPVTGQGWTEEELNGLGIGVWLWASFWTPEQWKYSYCTQVYADVQYADGSHRILRPVEDYYEYSPPQPPWWTLLGAPDGDASYVKYSTSGLGLPQSGGEFICGTGPNYNLAILLQEYAPVLYLHPQEQFPLREIDSMLGQSDLRNGEEITGPITTSDLEAHNNNDYYLDIWNASPDPDAWIWWPERFEYYDPVVYERAYEDADYIALQYWFFYPYNSWERTYQGKPLVRNHHEGDWEMITIVLDKATGTPQRLSCAQHTGGRKYSWQEVQLIGGTHPKIFIAQGSHASYATAGEKVTVSRYCTKLENRCSFRNWGGFIP